MVSIVAKHAQRKERTLWAFSRCCKFRFGSTTLSALLTNIGELLLTLAMAAMGMEVDIRFFAKVGGRALLTGAAATAILCLASLALIRLLL